MYIQRLIENAWRKGFDLAGMEQLGQKLVNTRKWIGATEIAAVLHSLRVRYGVSLNVKEAQAALIVS